MIVVVIVFFVVLFIAFLVSRSCPVTWRPRKAPPMSTSLGMSKSQRLLVAGIRNNDHNNDVGQDNDNDKDHDNNDDDDDDDSNMNDTNNDMAMTIANIMSQTERDEKQRQ